MNDNDGLLKPLIRPDGQNARVGNRVLFGTDIPDPTAIGDDVSITYKIEETFGPRKIYRPTFERYYEIDDTPSHPRFPLSQAFAWCVIMLMLALALYSIVWGF